MLRRFLALGALTVALVAAAGSASAATGLSIAQHYWEVGIADSASVRVASGGSYADCTSKPIAALNVMIHLRGTPAGAPYSIVLIGPAIAGRSLTTQEGNFDGKGGNVDPAFLTLSFPKLKADGVSDFPPGTYRFELKVSHRIALSQAITIVKRAGC